MALTLERAAADRREVTLAIREDLLTAAAELGLHLEALAERGIALAVKKAREDAWRVENREAIEAHNKWIEEHGVPLRPIWEE